MRSALLSRLDIRKLTFGLVLLALAGPMLYLASRLTDPSVLRISHFIQYWAAARIHLAGGDPYSIEQVRALQVEAGWPADEPLNFFMWNPPWTLPLLLPFGLLPFALGRAVWLLLNLGLLLFAVEKLWKLYGGPAEKRWIAWAVGFTFFPTMMELQAEQTSPLMLLGVVGFLALERRGRPALAGAVAALTVIKPHLCFLFWIALVLWSLDRRRWSALAGAAAAGLAAVALPLLLDPAVYGQYRAALAQHHPTHVITPTLGSLLRLAVGPEPYWLQFVPVAGGVAWLLVHWWRRRQTWDWLEQMPLLVAVSLLTTAYLYVYDLVLLLVPVLAAAAWTAARDRRPTTRLALGLHAVISGTALLMNVQHWPEYTYVWMLPAVLLAYLLLRRPEPAAALAPAPAPLG
jgi:hypothetical protein